MSVIFIYKQHMLDNGKTFWHGIYIYIHRIEIPERVEHTIAAGTQEIGRACSANKIGNLLGAKLGISRIR